MREVLYCICDSIYRVNGESVIRVTDKNKDTKEREKLYEKENQYCFIVHDHYGVYECVCKGVPGWVRQKSEP